MTQVFGDSIFNEDVRFFGPTSFIGYLATVDDLLVNNSITADSLSVGNTLSVSNSITANSFIKSGGTSNAFLKADGSLDTATYVTAATVGGVVDNTGGQLVLRSGTGGFSAGIVTITSLNVNGNARITGIVSTSSVTDLSGGYLSTPPGTVITVAASTAPTGYLKANGASLNTTTYASLFAAIGYTFGGSGASFTLPDLRGEFIRGWADDRAVDTGRTFGSSQGESYLNHSHNVTNYLAGSSLDGANSGGAVGVFNHTSSGNKSTDSSTTGGTETRPRNIALLYCIKY
jgi:microcystin-dependent protein/cytoskeletal protein CcmA (bactofilin family)